MTRSRTRLGSSLPPGNHVRHPSFQSSAIFARSSTGETLPLIDTNLNDDCIATFTCSSAPISSTFGASRCVINPGAVGVAGDLRDTWSKVVRSYQATAKGTQLGLLAACPPWQGMSSARSFRGKEADPDAGMKDKRNLLVTVISEVACKLRPRAIVVENVPAFLTRAVRSPKTGTAVSAARLLIDELSSAYTAFPLLADLCDYGIPQRRKRTFITFLRNDEKAVPWLQEKLAVPYPLPRHAREFGGTPITVRQALSSFRLPSLDARTETRARSRVGKGLHSVPVWPKRRYEMVAAIPPHTGRGAWQNDRCKCCGARSTRTESAYCLECGNLLPRPIVEDIFGEFRLITGFRSTTYTRMKSDAPAAAITTASGNVGSNKTIHPFENRLLSPLECALLQTLPMRFNWGNAPTEWGHSNIRKMIGEAVPPLFTMLHGRILRSLLTGGRRSRLDAADGKRSKAARRKLDLGRVSQ